MQRILTVALLVPFTFASEVVRDVRLNSPCVQKDAYYGNPASFRQGGELPGIERPGCQEAYQRAYENHHNYLEVVGHDYGAGASASAQGDDPFCSEDVTYFGADPNGAGKVGCKQRVTSQLARPSIVIDTIDIAPVATIEHYDVDITQLRRASSIPEYVPVNELYGPSTQTIVIDYQTELPKPGIEAARVPAEQEGQTFLPLPSFTDGVSCEDLPWCGQKRQDKISTRVPTPTSSVFDIVQSVIPPKKAIVEQVPLIIPLSDVPVAILSCTNGQMSVVTVTTTIVVTSTVLPAAQCSI